MFLGFERALRQYMAIVELLRKDFFDDALILVRSLYELNVELSAVKSEEGAEEFLAKGEHQRIRLMHQRREDEPKDAEQTGDAAEIDAAEAKLNQPSFELNTQFSASKLSKGGWQKPWSGQSVEQLARDLAQETGAPPGHTDYWVYRLGSLFTHDAPGALFLGLKHSRLNQDQWKKFREERDQASKQGLAPVLHEASMCFVDITGMAGPFIQGYEPWWFDAAMQKILPALCNGDAAEKG